MRVLACIHLAFLGYGLYLMADSGMQFYRNPPADVARPFWAMVLINLILMSFLSYAASLLWRRRALGLKVSLAVFAAEFVYFFAIGAIWAFGGQIATSAAGATGIGNMGLAPQELTGYPVIGGVIAAILLFRTRRRSVIAQA